MGRALSSHFDARLIMQPDSRLVIDSNRCRAASWICRLAKVQTFPVNEAVCRIHRGAGREIFDPYHRNISRHFDVRRDAGRTMIIVSLHSFTPIYAGIPWPWHVSVLENRNPNLSLTMFRLLEQEGDLVVGNNEPYSVTDENYASIPVHGEQRGLSHLTLEIRQDLLHDKAGQIAWAERLARMPPQAIEKAS